MDHPFFRRGFRLIRGTTLPGTYNASNATLTRGFSFASENAVYVQGNYNATGIASVGTPTPSTDYLPTGAADIPASVVGDAVVILSNNWTDSRSFRSPFSPGSRPATETFTRFAIIGGDAKSTLAATPTQGSDDSRLGGGIHNFKRLIEDWDNVRLNYSGSLINLYTARNNNGTFKTNSTTYKPPTRNWVFDSSFLDPNRLPPGTPFFQYIQTSGFQRSND